MTDPAHATAVIVVRAWFEDGEHDRLRARITQTLDVTSAGGTTSAVATAQAIRDAVDGWLTAFLTAQRDP